MSPKLDEPYLENSTIENIPLVLNSTYNGEISLIKVLIVEDDR